MKSSGSSFETILESILKQKQVLDDMQVENEALRQQLAELKAGRGIYVEVLGTRIPLAGAPVVQVVDVVSNYNPPIDPTSENTAPVLAAVSTAETDAALQETTAIQSTDADQALLLTTASAARHADLSSQQNTAFPGEVLQTAGRETPMPGVDFVIEDVSENEVPLPVRGSSNFLEEAMLAEFSAASPHQVGNRSGPNTNGHITNNPDLDEDEKAALRRELMGSYILE